MTSTTRPVSLVVAAASALALGGGLLSPAGAAAADAGAVSGKSGKIPERTVTLITGDVVHFTDLPGDQDVVTVDRPAGATGGVHVQSDGERTYVIPQEAERLLAQDRLDRRLFDVTTLVKMGYDDARSGSVPVIASAGRTAAKTRAAAPAAPRGSKAVRTLQSISATALKVDKDRGRDFFKDLEGIGKVWLDGRVKANLKESVPQIGAPQAWAKGYDGKGAKVAVLDTGVDATHPDLKDRIAGSKSFVPGEEVTDKHGHGTHVASTVGGTGAASDGAYKGVAPQADLLIGKVLDDSGYGEDSSIIEAMEWAKADGADVVSMSLGSQQPDDGNDPMAQAVNSLSANGGPLYVIAAGNSGGEGTVSAPGSAASALTVAAVDKSDGRAGFSSQGPLFGSYGLKPDVAAPGVAITAAASQAQPNPPGMYEPMDGTSMATPHVAGAAAILKQRHPDWDGQRIKDALLSSSKALADDDPYSMGAGRVDVAAAVDAAVTATGSVDAGVFKWPHESGETAERTITYRNDGTAAAQLKLAAGSSAAKLSADTVTVPAGGTAEVKVALDPAAMEVGSHTSGLVTATGADGKAVAHTAYGLFKEDERYDTTLKLTDRAGKPASGRVALMREGNQGPDLIQVDGGSETLRLPAGDYLAYWWPDVPGSRPDSLAAGLVIDPEVSVRADTVIGLDARKLRKVSAEVDRPVTDRQRNVDFNRVFGDGSEWRDMFQLPVTYDEIWVTPTEKPERGSFDQLTRWRYAEPNLRVTAGGRDIPVLQQIGGASRDGRGTPRTVYAGKGAAADYEGLDAKGKAVLVRRSDDVEPLARAEAAVKAGAALLIVIGDERGRLSEWYEKDDGSSQPIPVVTVMREAGDRLVAGAGQPLSVTEKRWSEYVYDLVDQHQGAIPDRLSYRPDHDDLARIDARYYGTKEAPGAGFRYNIPAWGPGIGFKEREWYPGTRTEYVTPKVNGAGFWYENHAYDIGGGQDDWEQRSGEEEYAADRRYSRHWFEPIVQPRFGDGYESTVIDRSGVQVNVPMWSDSGAGHSGAMGADEYDTGDIALYQGDSLVKRMNGRALWADLPQETKPYRVVAQSGRDAKTWGTSTKVRTEFGFVYEPLPEGVFQKDLRLLNPRLQLPTTGLDGRVPAGSRPELTFAAATQDWMPDRVTATEGQVSASYDGGKTWHELALRPAGAGTWKTRLDVPDTSGGSVSLRLSAKAPGGYTVAQEIKDAVLVR
ncbi:S8 family serine peptidase [Streptomyces sp. A7024]|uniref:S8 family serine peptidase n=1 Tax=Streptomyces coryli TaxID=1128680 RepID=A0A6G4U4S3_9ACTN|nr:S8 family serine peptidase [Streptomyces coryli]NGN67093.1 S8 family serine peptidase [Streptomyces coryli]